MEDGPADKKIKVEEDEINSKSDPVRVEDSVPVSMDSGSSYQLSQLESLPVEILHLIFHYLSTCDKRTLQIVCRRFQFVLNDPNHWRHVIIPHNINSKNPRYVKSVLKQTKSHAKSLSLVGYIPTSRSDVSFLTSCHSITALDLYGSHLSTTAMKQAIRSLPNISRLSVGNDAAYTLLATDMLASVQQLVIHDTMDINSFSMWLTKETRPPNLAIVADISSSMSYDIIMLANPLYPSRDTNLSVYDISKDCTLDRLSIPSVNYSSSSSNVGFHIPGTDTDSDWFYKSYAIVVTTAVSSSVLSPTVNYTYANVDDLEYSHVEHGTVTRYLDADIAASITSLNISGKKLQSLGDICGILELTPNLQVISINGIRFPKRAEYPDPLDMLFKPLSMHCHKLKSISSIVADNICNVEDISEIWDCILSLKHLEHLSICSCLFEGASSPSQQQSFHPNLKLLPACFQSLILHIHQTEYVKVSSFDRIFSTIGDIQNLQVLHVYVSYLRDNRQLNLKLLLETCTKVTELGVFNMQAGRSSLGRKLVHSPAIGRLKCFMLKNVELTKAFFTDLIPYGQDNTNLQMLHIEVHKMWTEEMTRIMEHCPHLVSFSVHFLSSFFPGGGFGEHCKEAKKVAKRLKLLNFTCRKYKLENSISNNFYFSMLKLM